MKFGFILPIWGQLDHVKNHVSLCLKSLWENTKSPDWRFYLNLDPNAPLGEKGISEEIQETIKIVYDLVTEGLNQGRKIEFITNPVNLHQMMTAHKLIDYSGGSCDYYFHPGTDYVFGVDWDTRLLEHLDPNNEGQILSSRLVEPVPDDDRLGRHPSEFQYNKWMEWSKNLKVDDPKARNNLSYPFLISRKAWEITGGFSKHPGLIRSTKNDHDFFWRLANRYGGTENFIRVEDSVIYHFPKSSVISRSAYSGIADKAFQEIYGPYTQEVEQWSNKLMAWDNYDPRFIPK